MEYNLTKNDEQELALKIQAGLKALDSLKTVNDSFECEKLNKLVEEGNQAREVLVNANLKFVTYVAKDYINKGLAFNDVYQSGCLGLTIAANKFNPNMDVQFCTYAKFWIKEAIITALRQNRRIYLPNQAASELSNVRVVRESLEEKLGRKPSVDEIANVTGYSKEKVLFLIENDRTFTSLDKEIGEETSLGDMIASGDLDVQSKRLSKELTNTLYNAIETELNEKEKDIVLSYANGDSFQAIGDRMGISRERVRQIYLGAINKIKRSAYYNDLKLLYNE